MPIFVFFFALIASGAWAKTHELALCNSFLSEPSHLTVSEQFAAYLKRLHLEGVVTTETLTVLKTQLENHTDLSNPLVKNSSKAEAHYDNVEFYLHHTDLDRSLLLAQINSYLTELKQVEKKRDKNRDETKDAFQKMRFYPIQKGKFTQVITSQTDGRTIELETAIDHSFLMMSTKVTEKMWAEIYGSDQADMAQPDLPVTEVDIWSIMEFANALSRRDGLEPVYKIDLKQLRLPPNYKPGIRNMQNYLRNQTLTSISDTLTGRYQDSEGYRLPTLEEQQFVRTNRGVIMSNQLFPGIDGNNYFRYAWLNGDSRTLQAVGQLLPFLVDDYEFYDLYGNATEWALFQDLARSTYWQTTFLGGQYDSPLISAPYETRQHTTIRHPNLGFRLVRTIKDKK